MPHARFKELKTPVALFAMVGRRVNLLLSASRALRDPATRNALREHFDPSTIIAALHDNLIPSPA
jgi:hypothetical protein